jgi:hypothetical protein
MVLLGCIFGFLAIALLATCAIPNDSSASSATRPIGQEWGTAGCHGVTAGSKPVRTNVRGRTVTVCAGGYEVPV